MSIFNFEMLYKNKINQQKKECFLKKETNEITFNSVASVFSNEHAFKLLRSYCSIVLLLWINTITLYVLIFINKVSSMSDCLEDHGKGCLLSHS